MKDAENGKVSASFAATAFFPPKHILFTTLAEKMSAYKIVLSIKYKLERRKVATEMYNDGFPVMKSYFLRE